MSIKRYSKIGMGCFITISILLLNACTKNFKNYNTDPNALPSNQLNYDNVYLGGFFKNMAENVIPVEVNPYQVVQNLAGDVFGGYDGQTHNWNATGDNTTYNFNIGWNGAAFDRYYTNIVKNYDTIRKYSVNSPDVIAVAKIMKVAAAHRVVDMYGPIPYFNTNGILGSGAQYDAQDKIYYSFFNDLDSAIKVLEVYNATGANPLAFFDPIYRGSYVQWMRFANSLKLRLAMRIVYVDEAKAKQYAEEAVNSPEGVILKTDDNAELRGVDANDKYIIPLRGVSVSYNEARMSANMESFLLGYDDPRVSALFQTSTRADDPSKPYKGIRSGITINDGLSYQPFSILQTDFNLIWMSAAEVSFLRAEGALRGWNMGASAQSFYESGIQASFDQWKSGSADAYMNNSTSVPLPYTDPVDGSNSISNLTAITIQWDEASGFEEKLERIGTQKWIAMYPNGQEAWSEFRRTGYPKLFPVKVNQGNDPKLSSPTYPVKRIPYPAGEYTTNASNISKALGLLGGSDLAGVRLWWDKNPTIPDR